MSEANVSRVEEWLWALQRRRPSDGYGRCSDMVIFIARYGGGTGHNALGLSPLGVPYDFSTACVELCLTSERYTF
jgi:hypothetical protein